MKCNYRIKEDCKYIDTVGMTKIKECKNCEWYVNLSAEKETKFLGKNEPVNLYNMLPPFFIKSKTNDGEFAKQYFSVLDSETTSPSLIIHKLVLTDNFALYQNSNLLKIYKGMGLFEERFGIKLSTLNIVIDKLKSLEL